MLGWFSVLHDELLVKTKRDWIIQQMVQTSKKVTTIWVSFAIKKNKKVKTGMQMHNSATICRYTTHTMHQHHVAKKLALRIVHATILWVIAANSCRVVCIPIFHFFKHLLSLSRQHQIAHHDLLNTSASCIWTSQTKHQNDVLIKDGAAAKWMIYYILLLQEWMQNWVILPSCFLFWTRCFLQHDVSRCRHVLVFTPWWPPWWGGVGTSEIGASEFVQEFVNPPASLSRQFICGNLCSPRLNFLSWYILSSTALHIKY